jgi:hypothetical protein
MIILKVLLGIVMIVLYIILRVKLLNETRTIYKAGYFAVGVSAMIWAVLWALNIAKYNTIIYYPIIELFK